MNLGSFFSCHTEYLAFVFSRISGVCYLMVRVRRFAINKVLAQQLLGDRLAGFV